MFTPNMASARSGGRSVPETERRTNSSLRGPLARLDRSREELAKAWLVRVIGRASLDEIRTLPTDRIAAQLPDLFADVLEAAAGDDDPFEMSPETHERAARLAELREASEPAASDLARDVAAMQSVMLEALGREAEEHGRRRVRPPGCPPVRRRGSRAGGRGRDAGEQALPGARVAGEHRPAHRPLEPPAPAGAAGPGACAHQALRAPLRAARDRRGRAQAGQRLARPRRRRPRAGQGGAGHPPVDPHRGHAGADRGRRVLRPGPRRHCRVGPDPGRAPGGGRDRRDGGRRRRRGGRRLDRRGRLPGARR